MRFAFENLPRDEHMVAWTEARASLAKMAREVMRLRPPDVRAADAGHVMVVEIRNALTKEVRRAT